MQNGIVRANLQWFPERVEFYAILFLMIVLLLLAWILLGMQDVPPPRDVAAPPDVSRVSTAAR